MYVAVLKHRKEKTISSDIGMRIEIQLLSTFWTEPARGMIVCIYCAQPQEDAEKKNVNVMDTKMQRR